MVNKYMVGRFLGAMLIVVFAYVVGTSEGVAAAAPVGQQVHGYLQTQVIAPSETLGTITHGGLLNGTTQDQISFNTSTGTVTYTATFMDVTEDGVLVTQDTGQSFSDGTFVEHGIVDGKASTGKFVGASGWLTFGGTSIDEIHYTATVSGEIYGASH
jgi:hypothetical protein